jgi:Na+/melibiose symporter-like transporter
MSEDAIVGGCLLSFLAIVVGAAIGWIMNIVKIFAALNDPLTGLFVGRVIGVFVFPIGCVAGWM